MKKTFTMTRKYASGIVFKVFFLGHTVLRSYVPTFSFWLLLCGLFMDELIKEPAGLFSVQGFVNRCSCAYLGIVLG